MRSVLIAGAIVLSGTSNAQFLIDQEFNGGATPPTGWTFTSISSSTTASTCGRSTPALLFNATNDRVVTATWALGDQISFMMRGSGDPGPLDRMRVEGFNGTVWSVIADVKPHSTATTTTLAIPTNIVRVRFTYTKDDINVTFDDVTVRLSESCGGTGLKVRLINLDACGSSCEGRDEFFTFTTGSTAVTVSNIEYTYPDANNSSVTWCGTAANAPCDNYLVTNPTAVGTLNTMAGCVRFISPGASIPANSNVIIFNGNPQSTVTNFSSLCGDPVMYYAVFARNTSDCNGRFGNYQTGGDTYRGLFLRDRGTGCTDTVSYRRNNPGLSNGSGSSVDGASVLFDSPPRYLLTNCTFAILPIELIGFNAQAIGGSVSVRWTTANEVDNAFFEVERSATGEHFEAIGHVLGAGNSVVPMDHEWMDEQPLPGVGYYRLRQVDIDGAESFGPVVAVRMTMSSASGMSVFPNPFHSSFEVVLDTEASAPMTLQLLNSQGAMVTEEIVQEGAKLMVGSADLAPGLYYLIVDDGTERHSITVVKE